MLVRHIELYSIATVRKNSRPADERGIMEIDYVELSAIEYLAQTVGVCERPSGLLREKR